MAGTKSRMCILWLIIISILAGCRAGVEQDQVSPKGEIVKTTESNQGTDRERTEVIDLVETFSEDVGETGQETLQKLQSYPRENLINLLSGLQQTLPEHDRLRPKISFVLCIMDYEYDKNKQVIVSALSRIPRFRDFAVEDAQGMLARLISRGDKRCLRILFAASLWSDGALSEGLADTFTQELRKAPEEFLLQLKDEPAKTRYQVYEMIGYSDSLSSDEIKQLIGQLSSIPEGSPVAATARELLKSRALRHPQ